MCLTVKQRTSSGSKPSTKTLYFLLMAISIVTRATCPPRKRKASRSAAQPLLLGRLTTWEQFGPHTTSSSARPFEAIAWPPSLNTFRKERTTQTSNASWTRGGPPALALSFTRHTTGARLSRSPSVTSVQRNTHPRTSSTSPGRVTRKRPR